MNYKEILDSTRQSAQQQSSSRCAAFSLAEGNQGPTQELDIRLRTGDCWAFPYAYKTGMKFDLSGMITIYFSTHVVTIEGQNLAALYEGLVKHAVIQIRQQPNEFDEAAEDEPVISSLSVKEL